jgi:regulator of protease activity HflC (stomatin/prohibitin superfamily)
LRKQTLEVTGQEILTKDRVSIRVNLTASVKVENAVTAAEQVDNLNDFIYKTMQLALREAVGTKTLDELLVDKLYVNETVSGLVMDELQEVGVLLNRVGVKDIILPGDIKSILNQVVEAQKSAEANVIKRREETAATRSLHNTAKMMEGNPTLLRLKELEALEKVSERVGNLNVYGGLDHLMTQTVKLS